MSVKVEKIAENKVKLIVTVDKEEFAGALDVAFKKVVKDITVAGFRKGKLPRHLFERKYGVEALYEDAANYIIQKTYPGALIESKAEAVSQPDIDVDFENMGKDKPFTYTAEIVVKPEVKLGLYKGIEVKPLSKEVTEEEINAEIEALLKRYSELIIKDDAAEDGDTVVIDYEGFIDEKSFEGGTAKNYSLVLGSNSFIPGFEQALEGIKPGEEKDISVKFPDDYFAEDLQGKDALFKVKCHEVKTLQKPELNDDFIKDLNRDNINSIEDLKTEITDNLTKKKEIAYKNHLIDSALETAGNNAEINIPEIMIENEINNMLGDTERRLKEQGITLDLYYKYTGTTEEILRNNFKKDAEKRVRYGLTLEQISKEENIAVTDEEIKDEITKISLEYNIPLTDVNTDSFDKTFIEKELKNRKVIDLLVENIKEI